MILSGSSHPQLAKKLAQLTGLTQAEVDISEFPNGEKRIWVRSKLTPEPVVVVQSFSAPVDQHIIEFCLLLDAAHHSGAKTIIGVVPWFGYSPQDKLFRPGEPISVHVIARMLQSLHLDHLIVMDIHAKDSLKHFSIPVTEVSAVSLYVNYFKSKNLDNHVAVALDTGALSRAKEFSRRLRLPLVEFAKVRDHSTGKVTFTTLRGEVKGKHVVSFDDFVSTGSTRIAACRILKRKGALSYTDCITHALLTGKTSARLQASSIDRIFTTDSYPIPQHKRFPKLTVLPIAPLLAKALTPLL